MQKCIVSGDFEKLQDTYSNLTNNFPCRTGIGIGNGNGIGIGNGNGNGIGNGICIRLVEK